MDETVCSEPTVEGESNDALIAVAKQHGFDVSKRQLAEWHRAGLLPEPVQVHGDRLGSTSVYPPGTAKRLLDLCESRKRSSHDLGGVAWSLWWCGWDVPMTTVRDLLSKTSSRWTRGIRLLGVGAEHSTTSGQSAPELSEQAWQMIDTAEKRRLSPDLGGVRKRVGRGNFPTFARVLIEAAIGAFPGFDVGNPETAEEDRKIVEKAMGLDRARKDRLSDAGPWLTGDFGEVFQLLGTVVTTYPPGHDLHAAQDEDLVTISNGTSDGGDGTRAGRRRVGAGPGS